MFKLSFMNFNDWIESAKQDADKLYDPVNLLGDDFYNFDKFMEWLEIPLEFEDKEDARESLLGTFDVFVGFGYFAHASLIIEVINNIEDRWITN